MTLDQAVKEHRGWRKNRFFLAIAKSEKLDVTDISSDQGCTFGKWLHTEGMKKFGHLDHYQTCLQAHAAFHAEAGKVAVVLNDGDVNAVNQMLGLGTPYTKASEALSISVIALFQGDS